MTRSSYDRENYIVGEMDVVNRQLECEFLYLIWTSPLLFRLSSEEHQSCRFVVDHVGEKERVAERLEQEAVADRADGPQHFWLSGYNALILATLKDRVWRGVILIELCRATLNRIHEVMFPAGP